MKAAFVAVVPTLMLVIGMAHWNIGQDQLTQLFDGIVAVVQDALILVAAVVAVVGFARKLILSVQGQNQVNQVPLVVPTQLGAPPSNLPGGQA